MPQSKFADLRRMVDDRPYLAVNVSNTLSLLDVCEAAEAYVAARMVGNSDAERDALRAALEKFGRQG